MKAESEKQLKPKGAAAAPAVEHLRAREIPLCGGGEDGASSPLLFPRMCYLL